MDQCNQQKVQVWMNVRGVWPLLALSSYLIQIKKCESLKLTNSLKEKMKEITVWPLFTQPS